MSKRKKKLPTKDPTTLEERERIIAAVTKTLSEKDRESKDFDELKQLSEFKTRVRLAVKNLIEPIIENAKMLSPLDPRYIHTETGRAYLYITGHKLFLDQIRNISREEAIFLLAFAWSEMLLNEYV